MVAADSMGLSICGGGGGGGGKRAGGGSERVGIIDGGRLNEYNRGAPGGIVGLLSCFLLRRSFKISVIHTLQ